MVLVLTTIARLHGGRVGQLGPDHASDRQPQRRPTTALPFDHANVKRVVNIFVDLLFKQLAAVDYEALVILGGCCDGEKVTYKKVVVSSTLDCTAPTSKMIIP